MVDECIDHGDVGEMNVDGIFECSREPHFGGTRGTRVGRCDDLAFTMRSSRRKEKVGASATWNVEERREHLTEEEPKKHASGCMQRSWCTTRAGGRVGLEQCTSSADLEREKT
mmetsp:Transcript_102055/g.266315  ORF Transcript_102055/g.266315 Transcript_102055/m.266315 type:complete len:113 (+) Transcript_102055:2-340(+)